MVMMRLTDAIRLGSTISEQTYGCYANKEMTRTCAMGGAMLAIGRLSKEGVEEFGAILHIAIPKEWNWAMETHVQCPVKGCEKGIIRPLISSVMHLNDYHEWDREKIADYVERFEPLVCLPDIPEPKMLDEVMEEWDG